MKLKLLFLSGVVACSGCSNRVVGSHDPPQALEICVAKILKVNPTEALLTLKAVKSVKSVHGIHYFEDGHLYTTLKIAEEAGIPLNRALMLAYYTQYPDIDINYEATPVAIKFLMWPPKWDWRNLVTGQLHSLHGRIKKLLMLGDMS